MDNLKSALTTDAITVLQKAAAVQTGRGGGAGYFGKRKWREKWPEKRKSIKNQRQPATEIEVLQSEIRKL